jgi:hypothetical protein
MDIAEKKSALPAFYRVFSGCLVFTHYEFSYMNQGSL